MIELYHIIRFCDSVSSPNDHFFGFARENGDETMTGNPVILEQDKIFIEFPFPCEVRGGPTSLR
jgi:hypothetical protein